jgi:hypothetical protein
MQSLDSYLNVKFDSLRSQWEEGLLRELKISEVGHRDSKRLLAGFNWPVLSLDRATEISLTPERVWKKAAVTYTMMPKDLKSALQEDLAAGVKNFFFHNNYLRSDSWNIIEGVLGLDPETEVFIPEGSMRSNEISLVTNLISGKEFHDLGGNTPQELGLLASKLVNFSDDSTEVYLGVFVDSLFFQNIAKIRSARLLAQRIFEHKNISKKIIVVAQTSFQGWSLYERYSNMLRNMTALASSYIGGADVAQSAGYQSLLELEVQDLIEDEHFSRSRRMARNSCHVLALESMLGVVHDASYGSYHLENLTQKFCHEAWMIMQEILRGDNLTSEVLSVRDQRLKHLKTRKTIMSGINDYPDAKEYLGVTLKEVHYFRQARSFEELRLRMEKMKKPSVYIAVFGDYASLNARLNFARNYFELLGLNVTDSGVNGPDLNREYDIFVLCAADETYSGLNHLMVSAKYKYIAGKIELPGFKNIFSGQDVFEVLKELMNDLSGDLL